MTQNVIRFLYKAQKDMNLTIDDLQEVRQEVEGVSSRWRQLALSLGLHHNSVELIESNHRFDSERSLEEALKLWLQQSYDTKRYPLPSWTTLCTAVADKSGGYNPALAAKITSKHK